MYYYYYYYYRYLDDVSLIGQCGFEPSWASTYFPRSAIGSLARSYSLIQRVRFYTLMLNASILLQSY